MNYTNVINTNMFILDSGATQLLLLVCSELDQYMADVTELKDKITICVAIGKNMTSKRKRI